MVKGGKRMGGSKVVGEGKKLAPQKGKKSGVGEKVTEGSCRLTVKATRSKKTKNKKKKNNGRYKKIGSILAYS